MFYDEYEPGTVMWCKGCYADRPTETSRSDGSTVNCTVCGYHIAPLDSRLTEDEIGEPTYERTVKAALAETVSKFKLAEALALDIPPQRGADAVTYARLSDARQAILDAGGEPRAVETLANYRRTAQWVYLSSSTDFRWLPGVSYSAHDEARRYGLSYERFSAMPARTVDAIRRETGRAGTDGPPTQIARGWSPEQKVDALRELLSDPDTAREVMSDPDTARDVVTAAPAQVVQAQLQRHKQIQDRIAPPGSRERQIRDQAETRYQVLEVVQRLVQVRLAVSKIPEIGMISEGEREMLREEAGHTLPTVQFLADLTSEQASLDDQVAEFLRSQA